MMQVCEMKTGLPENIILSPKFSGISRNRIKMALKQFRDWWNTPPRDYLQRADFKTIDERIREQRVKYEGLRFPYHF